MSASSSAAGVAVWLAFTAPLAAQAPPGCPPETANYAEWAIEGALDPELRPVMRFACASCAPDALPAITLTAEGSDEPLPGRVERLRDEHGAEAPFALWIPDEPLVSGTYVANATPPAPLPPLEPLTLEVAPGPTPRPDLELTLEAELGALAEVAGGTLLSDVCELERDRCGAMPVSTRLGPKVVLDVRGSHSPAYTSEERGEVHRVSGAYVHRARVVAADGQVLDDGEWGNLSLANAGSHSFHVRHPEALLAHELCVEVESLRVQDGLLRMQARECIANPARAERGEPAPYVELSSSRPVECRERWHASWCDDNFDCALLESRLAFPICAHYLSRCRDDAKDAGGGTDAGPEHSIPAQAGDRGGSCGCLLVRPVTPLTGTWLLLALVPFGARLVRGYSSIGSLSRRPTSPDQSAGPNSEIERK